MLQDTSNPLRALRILQSLGEAIPHAGGIIRAIAGIGIVILETADRVRVNREECKDIARRVAEHIEVLRVLGVNEDGDLDLSEDVKLRLQNYLTVLKNVSKTVERLGGESSKRLPRMSVQDETNVCINKLNEAYQLYIFQFSISADTKLSTLINCMRALSLQLDTHSQTQSLVYTPHNPDANQPDAIRRIPSTNLTITSSLSRIQKKEYILYIESGYLLDRGERKAVIARKFISVSTSHGGGGEGKQKGKGKQKEVEVEVDDDSDVGVDEMRGWKAFDAEIEFRRNLLNIHFARLLGISVPSSRTKIIILSTGAGEGAVIAYEYLQSLPGLEYLHEHIRIMCEFASGYQYLRDHGGSWIGRFREITLNARDKSLCMGGLGTMDGRSGDSGWRMWESFNRLATGFDWNWRANASFESYTSLFNASRTLLEQWQERKDESSAKGLWESKSVGMWSGSSRAQEPREAVGEDGEVRWRNVGDIGWDDEVLSDGYSGSGRKVWNLIPLVHDFALHKPPSYDPSALRLLSHSHNPHSDQKNDAEHEGEGSQERVRVEATSTGGFTRWKFDVQRGEEVYLKTRVRTDCTNEIYNFFLGSAISLARQYGVDVPSLRLVVHAGIQVVTSIKASREGSIYYFAHMPGANGSIPDLPGFWSYDPDPSPSGPPSQEDSYTSPEGGSPFFQTKHVIHQDCIHPPVLALLQDLNSHGYLPVPQTVRPQLRLAEVTRPECALKDGSVEGEGQRREIDARGRKKKFLGKIFSKMGRR